MKKYITQIATGVLGLSLLATWFGNVPLALILLLVAGIMDVILDRRDDMETISQWVHKLFPEKVDLIILIGLLIIAWVIAGPAGFLPFCLGAAVGHLFWQENQEK